MLGSSSTHDGGVARPTGEDALCNWKDNYFGLKNLGVDCNCGITYGNYSSKVWIKKEIWKLIIVIVAIFNLGKVAKARVSIRASRSIYLRLPGWVCRVGDGIRKWGSSRVTRVRPHSVYFSPSWSGLNSSLSLPQGSGCASSTRSFVFPLILLLIAVLVPN